MEHRFCPNGMCPALAYPPEMDHEWAKHSKEFPFHFGGYLPFQLPLQLHWPSILVSLLTLWEICWGILKKMICFLVKRECSKRCRSWVGDKLGEGDLRVNSTWGKGELDGTWDRGWSQPAPWGAPCWAGPSGQEGFIEGLLPWEGVCLWVQQLSWVKPVSKEGWWQSYQWTTFWAAGEENFSVLKGKSGSTWPSAHLGEALTPGGGSTCLVWRGAPGNVCPLDLLPAQASMTPPPKWGCLSKVEKWYPSHWIRPINLIWFGPCCFKILRLCCQYLKNWETSSKTSDFCFSWKSRFGHFQSESLPGHSC